MLMVEPAREIAHHTLEHTEIDSLHILLTDVQQQIF
jgi:hypothetical protein